jgi:hypothetical protein
MHITVKESPVGKKKRHRQGSEDPKLQFVELVGGSYVVTMADLFMRTAMVANPLPRTGLPANLESAYRAIETIRSKLRSLIITMQLERATQASIFSTAQEFYVAAVATVIRRIKELNGVEILADLWRYYEWLPLRGNVTIDEVTDKLTGRKSTFIANADDLILNHWFVNTTLRMVHLLIGDHRGMLVGARDRLRFRQIHQPLMTREALLNAELPVTWQLDLMEPEFIRHVPQPTEKQAPSEVTACLPTVSVGRLQTRLRQALDFPSFAIDPDGALVRLAYSPKRECKPTDPRQVTLAAKIDNAGLKLFGRIEFPAGYHLHVVADAMATLEQAAGKELDCESDFARRDLFCTALLVRAYCCLTLDRETRAPAQKMRRPKGVDQTTAEPCPDSCRDDDVTFVFLPRRHHLADGTEVVRPPRIRVSRPMPHHDVRGHRRRIGTRTGRPGRMSDEQYAALLPLYRDQQDRLAKGEVIPTQMIIPNPDDLRDSGQTWIFEFAAGKGPARSRVHVMPADQ